MAPWSWVAAVILLCCLPNAVRADHMITSQVIASGGGTATSASHTVTATVGEGITGRAESPNHAINAGFVFTIGADRVIPSIPALSAWGLVVMTLVLLIGAKLYFGRREVAATRA